jgi:hypothetical protein
MARTSKAKTEQTETTSQPVAAPVQPVVAPAPAQPVVESKPKAPRAKKTPAQPAVATQAQAQAPPPVVPEQPVAPVTEEAPADVAELSELTVQSGEFLSKLNRWVAEGASLKSEFKALEKRWSRELKNAQKSKKRTKRGGNRSPSGFVKPTKISDELALFLEKPLGSEMARTEVTKEINNYIRANKLQDKDNGRKIVPDQKLSSLLKIGSADELTYFNLQKYMSPHFAKTVKEVPVALV